MWPHNAHLVDKEAGNSGLPAVASIVLLQLGIVDPVIVQVIQTVVPALILVILLTVAPNLGAQDHAMNA